MILLLVRGLTPTEEEPIAITMGVWKFLALATGGVALRDLTQSTLGQAAEQNYPLAVVLGRRACVAAAKHVAANKQTLDRALNPSPPDRR